MNPFMSSLPKGVGPSTNLACSGWKQPDIAVEVDTARLETRRLKKCCENCVPYYSTTLVLISRVLLTLMRMTKDEKGLAFFKGLLL
jgi:hypothetical protein